MSKSKWEARLGPFWKHGRRSSSSCPMHPIHHPDRVLCSMHSIPWPCKTRPSDALQPALGNPGIGRQGLARTRAVHPRAELPYRRPVRLYLVSPDGACRRRSEQLDSELQVELWTFVDGDDDRGEGEEAVRTEGAATATVRAHRRTPRRGGKARASARANTPRRIGPAPATRGTKGRFCTVGCHLSTKSSPSSSSLIITLTESHREPGTSRSSEQTKPRTARRRDISLGARDGSLRPSIHPTQASLTTLLATCNTCYQRRG